MEARRGPTLGSDALASIWIALSLAGVTMGLTLVFLAMRSVMQVGGACADGGPYVSAQPCPDGVPLAMIGGIWGGIICLGVYAWQCAKHRVPGLIALAWSALFLSLGWNFLEFGLNPPFGDGLAWGWLVCAVIFGLMGGLPLLGLAGPTVRSFLPRDPQGPVRSFSPAGMLRPSVVRASIPLNAEPGRSPSASSAPVSGPPDDLVSALERLAALRRSGALTQFEFDRAKRRLLEGGR